MQGNLFPLHHASTVHKILGIDQNYFIEYVVCPKCTCDAIYEYQDTFKTFANGTKEPRRCSYIAIVGFPLERSGRSTDCSWEGTLKRASYFKLQANSNRIIDNGIRTK